MAANDYLLSDRYERGVFTSRRWNLVLLLAVCLFAFLVNNRVFHTDIMESRNIITAREMVYDGHWIVPTMNGELRLEKPPLPTWIAAIVEMVLPDNIAAQRAAAALAATMLVLFFYFFALRLTRSERYAMICSLLLCTCYNLILMGRTASWDIWCHAFMMGAIYLLFTAFELRGRQLSRFAGAGVMLGLSFMSKGPVSFYALLLPFLVSYLVLYRPHAAGKWGGVGLMVALCLLVGGWWYVWVYLFHREEALYVLGKESASWTNHHVRPWYYYSTFFAETGVWALLLLTSLLFPHWLRRLRWKREYTLCLCWTVLLVVFLSLLPEKKNRYLLPMLLPAALTMGHIVCYWTESFRSWRHTRLDAWLYGINAWLVALVCLSLPVLAYIFVYAKGWMSLGMFVVLAAALTLCALYILVAAAVRRRPLALVVGVVLLFTVAEVLGMPYVGKLANNSDFKSIRATRSIPELAPLPFYYNQAEGLRIDIVYETYKKVLPLDLQNEQAVLRALPFVLVSQRAAAEVLPPSLLDRLELRFIDRYDDNRQQKSDKHYTPMFVNNVTVVRAAAPVADEGGETNP